MSSDQSPVKHFSLAMLERVTRDFVAPSSAFDPKAGWENRYAVYALVQNNRQFAVYDIPLGSLQITRVPLSGGASRLKVEYQKINRHGGPHRIAGEMECAGDALATPLRWQFTAELCPPPSSPAETLRTEHTMEARTKTLELMNAGSKRAIPRPAAYSSSWALFDAVQRLPRRPTCFAIAKRRS
jgi:hypothetical protein